MRHRSAKRDPTVFLVLGLVLVVAALLATRFVVGGSDEVDLVRAGDTPTTTEPTTDATTDVTAPVATPTPSPTPSGPPRLDLKVTGKQQCVATGVDTDLTALSFNIKSGRGGGSLPAIAATLRDSGADVILLQEVDRLRSVSSNVDMPAYFGAQLGYFHAFGNNVPYTSTAGYGTAILSRFPIVSTENTYLPRPGGTQQRGLLHAVIDVEGKEVSIYDTHLQNESEPARMLQVGAINNLVAADTRPRILGGDMNAQPTSRPMNVLATQWQDTWGAVGVGDGRTHPARSLRGRIDYLLSGGEGITPVTADVLPAVLSDHKAVRASYTIEGPDTEICFQKLS